MAAPMDGPPLMAYSPFTGDTPPCSPKATSRTLPAETLDVSFTLLYSHFAMPQARENMPIDERTTVMSKSNPRSIESGKEVSLW